VLIGVGALIRSNMVNIRDISPLNVIKIVTEWLDCRFDPMTKGCLCMTKTENLRLLLNAA